MGIKTIVPLTEVPSKKHLEDLENRIQCLSGRRIGKWSLVHAEYTPVLEEDNEAMSEFANRLQVLGEMADHPTPDTVHFALIDDVPLDSSILEFGRNERRNIFVLEARKPFIDVVETIGVYKRRHTERVEGLKYDVGDFSLKLGARYVHEVGGNWKSNTTAAVAKSIAEAVVKANESYSDKIDVLLYVPFLYLPDVLGICKGSSVKVGAQNFYHKAGAFTGEVNIEMLKDIGIDHVLVGHSERRHVFGEGDALLNEKARKALSEGFKVCFCIGEKLEEREAGQTDAVNRRQLVEGLKDVTAEEMKMITIAYEPVWAIGTGKTATPEDVKVAHDEIRKQLATMFNKETAEGCVIQYGGSVKPGNAEGVDGGLIGGASLKPADFDAIVKASKL